MNDEIAPKVRESLLNTIKKYHNKELSTRLHNDKKFKIDLEKTRYFIKNNPSILITRADKGNATVVITKSSYLEKTENLFKDQKYYNEIKKNPLPSLERKTNEVIKWLNKIDFTGNGTKLPSVLQKFNISKAYGLIKSIKSVSPLDLLFLL